MNLTKFNRLLREGRNGNLQSINELADYVSKQAAKTNRKMRALENANLDFYSYDRPKAALEMLGRSRFREKWSVDNIIDNWSEFEETARETYIFNERRRTTTPAAMKKYSEKRLSYLLDILGKSDRRGMSADVSERLDNSISNMRQQIGSDSEQIYQMERAIASGAISSLFSQQYGITGEAFEALYTAFENGAEFTTEVAEKIQDLTIGLQRLSGNTTTDIIEYIRSLGQ